MPSLDVILEQLKTANLLYQRQIPAPALELMASEWLETLGDMPDSLFVSAMRRHRKQSRYWPTEADVTTCADTLREEYAEAGRRNTPALPCRMGPMTEDERARTNGWLRKINETLSKGVGNGAI